MFGWLLGNRNASLIAEKRAERDALIDEARKLVFAAHESDVADTILTRTIREIVAGIERKEYTSQTVVEVFIRQAIVAHEATNCLTEVNFDAALKRAKELDEHFAKTGKLVGRLHGVPFSLKDHYSLRGKHSSTGYSEWFKKDVAAEDCMLAQVAQEAGAVCIAKTNVPQTMLNFECRNPAWGQTDNPYSRAHTAGGSSGGEAALLAVGGAAFGFGSDIGGSLRIPTSYCGIYAIKPSNGRTWPKVGNIDVGPAPTAIQAVAGPMCRCVDDLELLTRIYAEALYPDPSSVESLQERQRRFGGHSFLEVAPTFPLREAWLDPINAVSKRAEGKQTIRIGYYACDGFTKTSPACLRAVDVATKALSNVRNAQGNAVVELVKIDPAHLQTFNVMREFVGLTSITGYEHLKRHLGPDAIDRALFITLTFPTRPLLRRIVGFLARFVLGDRFLPALLRVSNQRKADRYFAHQYRTANIARAFQRDVWNAHQLDAILCPVQASVALPHYGTTLLPALAASTILYNVLGNPATVVPVCRVDPTLDGAMLASNSAWNEQPGHQTCSPMVASNLRKNYDAHKQAGLPVGVQIVTQEYEDERAIGLAKLLDDALAAHDAKHRHNFGPGAWQRFMQTKQR